MQSGDEEVLRACIAPFGDTFATIIGGHRAVVALPTKDSLFVDQLRGWAYVELKLPPRDRGPVLREILSEGEGISGGLGGTVSGRLEVKGEPREYLFYADALPGAPVIVDRRLAGVVVGRYGDIARVVPIAFVLDRIDYEELDPDAKAAICRAEGIRLAAGAESVHMEHLVYALGLIPDLDVCHRVEQEAKTKLPDTYDTPSLIELPPLSKHVREALDNAIRERESPDETRLRELYEGLFAVECGVVRVLIEAKVEIPNPTNAGYVSDVPTSESDPFGVHRYARALCTVLAAEEVKPPLSVGLFAPWGAGKTSFMKAMSDRFDAINALTKRNSKTAYRPHIVQLWFNAWHYAEQNLIASLADAVFEGLDTALTLEKKNANPETVDENALKKLALEKELAKAEDEAAESEKKLKAAQNDVAKIDAEIEAIKNDERTDAEIKEAAKGLSKDHYAKKVAKGLGADEKKIDELLKDVDDVWSVARRLLKSPRGWLILGGAIAIAVATVRFSIPAINLALPVLAFLEELFRIMRALKKARDATLAEHIAEKAKAEQQAAKAKTELEAADKKKDDLQSDIVKLTPGESLISFVRERRTSGTYSRQLSVAAEAHRDFRRLSAYIRQHDVDDVGVGRIVLYIDDLDRCPEDKVVEVLHAVHLLLAFDLFVVIVAVDSKWLLHSLKQYSRAFSERGSWRSTPLNYLEKIIQIPFTLDAMSEGGYANFIAGLTRSSATTTQTRRVAQAALTPKDEVAVQTPQELSRSAPPPPVDPNPKLLDFSPEETTFMSKDLYNLMSSPRNTKRFANVYRLIRATLSSSAREALVHEITKPYEPLMILVALITNHPEHASDVLAALERSPDPRPWRECIAETLLRIDDVPRGERMVADFRPWITHVARFLIQTGA